jgi:hypothetical protein
MTQRRSLPPVMGDRFYFGRESRWARCTVMFLGLLGTAILGCQRAEPPAPSESAGAVKYEEEPGGASSSQVPGVSPLYPVDAGELDPLAVRLCDALHTLPETRKAQCCGTPPAATLAGECAQTLSVALHDKAVTLDPEAAERCVEEASRKLEGCDWVTPLTPSAPEGCRNSIQGQLQIGARCRSSLECSDGLFCKGSGPTTSGVCAEPEAMGMTCAGTVDTLATYTKQVDYDLAHPQCAGYCQRGRCVAFMTLGGACSSSKQCAPGQHCVSGRCVDETPPKIGEACSGSFCEVGAVCREGKCTPLKRAGEPCTLPFECQATCIKPLGAQAGTCGMQCSNWSVTSFSSPSG